MAYDYLIDRTKEETERISIAEAIRTKGGTTAQLAWPDGFVQAVNDIQTGGSNPLEYATGVPYFGMDFPPGYELTLNMPNNRSTSYYNVLANRKGLKKFKLISPVISNVNGLNMFQNCQDLEEIDFTDAHLKFSTMQQMFYGCKKLKRIDGDLDLSLCTNIDNAFVWPEHLKEIRFAEGSIKISISFSWCRSLSAESVQSIIDGLATVTETKTVTFNSAVTVTPEQIAAAQAKNWTVVVQ